MKEKVIYGCEGHGDEGLEPYLTRITLIEDENWQLCLHKFHRSDHDRALHDHPWWFVTLILWRGYIEVTETGRRRKWPGMILKRNMHHRHRVELLNNKSAYTLVLMGKKKREWGFFTAEGWRWWQDYFKELGCR